MESKVGQQPLQQRNVGGYRLLDVLGHGGFADVYLAEHTYLRTQVALKVFRVRPNDEQMERFLAQTRALVRLHHPHILSILACDIEDGRPFLVMPYAPGGTLRQRHLRGSKLPLAIILTYVHQVASALDAAHRAGQVHGDLKPENMLLNARDELLLADFGFAPGVEQTTAAPASITGTVTYMAPEQLSAQPEPASDQYALAVLVYEWLCGEPPFSGTYTEVAMQHALVEPPTLAQRCPNLPPACERVLLRALTKDPRERFANIQTFAHALQQASNAPIRVRQGLSRRALVLGLTGAGGVAALGAGLSWKLFLNAALTPTLSAVYVYRGHREKVYALSWAPDSTRLVSADMIGSVQVWQAVARGTATPGKLLTSSTLAPAFNLAGNSFHGDATSLAWAPGTNLFAFGDNPGKIQVWDAANNAVRFVLREYSNLGTCLAWSPDSTRLAAAADPGAQNALIVAFWDMTSGNRLTDLQITSRLNIIAASTEIASPLALAWSPNGTWLALSNGSDATEIWDVPATRLRATLPVGSNDLAWSPNGRYLALARQVWDITANHPLHRFAADSNSMAWSPDGRYLATGGSNRTISIWNASTGEHLRTYQGHTAPINVVRWSPDGQFIASASDDQTVRIFASNLSGN